MAYLERSTQEHIKYIARHEFPSMMHNPEFIAFIIEKILEDKELIRLRHELHNIKMNAEKAILELRKEQEYKDFINAKLNY